MFRATRRVNCLIMLDKFNNACYAIEPSTHHAHKINLNSDHSFELYFKTNINVRGQLEQCLIAILNENFNTTEKLPCEKLSRADWKRVLTNMQASISKEKIIKMRNQENNSNKDANKSLEDHDHCEFLIKQASGFEATTKFIIKHTKENIDRGKGIAESLKQMSGAITDNLRTIVSVSTSNDKCPRDRKKQEV